MGSETNIENEYLPSGLDLDAIERENAAGGYVPHLKVAEFCAALFLGLLVGYLWAGF